MVYIIFSQVGLELLQNVSDFYLMQWSCSNFDDWNNDHEILDVCKTKIDWMSNSKTKKHPRKYRNFRWISIVCYVNKCLELLKEHNVTFREFSKELDDYFDGHPTTREAACTFWILLSNSCMYRRTLCVWHLVGLEPRIVIRSTWCSTASSVFSWAVPKASKCIQIECN